MISKYLPDSPNLNSINRDFFLSVIYIYIIIQLIYVKKRDLWDKLKKTVKNENYKNGEQHNKYEILVSEAFVKKLNHIIIKTFLTPKNNKIILKILIHFELI